MSADVYRYHLGAGVPAAEAEATLILALFGVEALHGEAQTRLDAGHAFDGAGRVVVIDASTPVGRDLNRLFVGFLTREFGPGGFRVERVDHAPGAKVVAPPSPLPRQHPVTA